MDLRGWEMYASSGSPIVGAVVKRYAASNTHPNAGAVQATTATDNSGMWEFTGLADGNYDIKVEIPGENKVKWYKGNGKFSFSVQTGNIEADAVTQLVDGGSTPPASSTTSNSNAVLDSVTFTATGGDIIIMFSAQVYNATAGNQTQFAAQIDSGTVKELTGGSQPSGSGSYYIPYAGMAMFTGIAAGSRVAKLLWRSPQGSTIAALSGGGQFFVLERKK